ncbi:MAG TPA: dienelactone hydrolase family protein [Caldimonas sp.]|nr:dienelactone hydrolase family protein [Caldimonas sp.]HEX4234956.1 dienelactone hydrolase family protein [Caldimonas sp.]
MLRTDDILSSATAVGATGVGFAAASGPIAAQAITTDDAALVAGEVTVDVGGFALPAYRAAPKGDGPFPIVLVVSEIFGVHAHIADVARRFAKLGYLAIAPELFVRQGDAKAPSDINTLFATIISKVPDTQVLADLDACVAWAKTHGGDGARLGVTGFCWGGRATWLYAAHNAALKAGVAWYGRLVGPTTALQPEQPIDVARRLYAPVLGLYGGVDTGIPLDSVEQMKAALQNGSDAARRSSIHVYPQASHAFYADYRPSYHRSSAEDGWQRCLGWLRAHGVA